MCVKFFNYSFDMKVTNLLKTLTLLLAVVCALPSMGQDEKTLSKDGQRAVDREEWRKAVGIYEQLIGMDAANDDYNFFAGLSYLKAGVDPDKAAFYFERVKSANFDELYYYQGLAYHRNSQFEKAIQSYNEFKNNLEDSKEGSETAAMVNELIAQCERGQSYMRSANDRMFADNMGAAVNTEYSEYAPIVIEDQGTVIYTSNKKVYAESLEDQLIMSEDIMYTTYDFPADIWSMGVEPDNKVVASAANTAANESSIGLSENGKNLYIFRNNDLWVSKNANDFESEGVDLGSFSVEEVATIYVSHDEKFRFLVSDKKGGKGGLDIYISKLDGGEWSAWTAAEGINTDKDDDSPYLGLDGNFYYSSNGSTTMGGHDIFKADWNNGDPKSPVNMGMPVNSPGNDIHFVLADNTGKIGYLASDRKGSKGNMDLYRVWTCENIENTTINGRLLVDGTPSEGSVTVSSTNGDRLNSFKIDKDGNFTLTVPTETNVNVEVVAENYLANNFRVAVPRQCTQYDAYTEIDIDLKRDDANIPTLQRGEMVVGFYDIDRVRSSSSRSDFVASQNPGDKYYSTPLVDEVKVEGPAFLAAAQFENITFGFDKSDVQGTAEAILQKIAGYLNKYDEITVTLTGHTDTKGAEWYNKSLSKRRARAVGKVLRDMGVDKDRINIEYMGETQPLVKDFDADGNYLEDAAAKNRRVEINLVVPEAEAAEQTIKE